MKWFRHCLSFLLLGIALLAAMAWIASYFRWPASGSFPWPSTGLEQTHDAGFVVLANGRLFILRQRIALAPSGTGSMPKLVDRAPSRADGTYLSADSRQLGTLKVTINTWKGPATTESSGLMSLGPLQPGLTKMPWKRLGFASQPLGTPRIALPGVMITAAWTSTAIPLWPFVLLGVPAAWLLIRGHQSRRWMEQGRCGACGYDLRESPERCPECGAAVAGADCPGTLGNAVGLSIANERSPR